MKKVLTTYSISLAFLLLSSILFSIIVTMLTTWGVFSQFTYELVTNIGAVVLFLVAGILLGYRIQRRGLLLGFLFAAVYFLIAWIIASSRGDITNYLWYINHGLRVIMIPIGAIIGVNLRK